MARKERNSVDYFPVWELRRTMDARIFDNLDKKDSFKAFRQSSSSFISNPIVRKLIKLKSGNECVKCKNKENLQIDHILSVSYCFDNKLFYICNTYENLQILCSKCNASKAP